MDEPAAVTVLLLDFVKSTFKKKCWFMQGAPLLMQKPYLAHTNIAINDLPNEDYELLLITSSSHYGCSIFLQLLSGLRQGKKWTGLGQVQLMLTLS